MFEGVSIYPNPSADVIHIKMQKQTMAEACITDLMGRLVKQFPPQNWNGERIDVCDLAQGIYFVTFTSGNSRMIRKIIVAR